MEVLAPLKPLFPDYLAKYAFSEKKFQTIAVPLEISDLMIYTFISLKQLGDPKHRPKRKIFSKVEEFLGSGELFQLNSTYNVVIQ